LPESAIGRHPQDGHDQSGSGWVVHLHLLRRGSNATTLAHRTGERDRPWH
jgi:hypothetical protein